MPFWQRREILSLVFTLVQFVCRSDTPHMISTDNLLQQWVSNFNKNQKFNNNFLICSLIPYSRTVAFVNFICKLIYFRLGTNGIHGTQIRCFAKSIFDGYNNWLLLSRISYAGHNVKSNMHICTRKRYLSEWLWR